MLIYSRYFEPLKGAYCMYVGESSIHGLWDKAQQFAISENILITN